MTNELQMTDAAANTVAALKAGIKNVKQSVPQDVSMAFLKMGKDGRWSFGAEDTEVLDGSEWALNPLSLRHGWVAWKRYPDEEKRKPEKVGDVMVSMSTPNVHKNDLEDLTEHNQGTATAKWVEAISMSFKCISGEDKGVEVMFNSNSYGGRKAFGVLVDALHNRLDVDPQAFVPIIELKSDHYTHESYGRTYEPVFSLVDWTTMEGPEAAPQVEEAPVEPEVVEEVVEAVASTAPAGRRARKAAAKPAPAAEQPVEAPVEARTRTRRPR